MLRGVRVGLAPDYNVLARAGSLQTVTWRILPEEEDWNLGDETEPNSQNDETTMGGSRNLGLLVRVSYERANYTAILLRRTSGDGQDSPIPGSPRGRFQHFPLLWTRMPNSLRETFLDFLSTTFDAYVSVLRLSGTYLTGSLEKYISDLMTPTDSGLENTLDGSRALRVVLKEVEVTIGFDLPSGNPGLKNMDVIITREDLSRWVSRGKKLGSTKARKSGEDATPFLDALSSYVRAHLALDLTHERVRILRISCGAFVLGAEGRVKITQPIKGLTDSDAHERATRQFVDGFFAATRRSLMIESEES